MAANVKEALGSARKPDLTHCRLVPATYSARAHEYGVAKYLRANHLAGVSPDMPTREAFERFRAYLRAGVSHLMKTLDSMEFHQAADPELSDAEGMRRAAYAEDDDPDVTGKVGPSRLPHLAAAIASVDMAATIAARAGLLPEDPGQPWNAPHDVVHALRCECFFCIKKSDSAMGPGGSR